MNNEVNKDIEQKADNAKVEEPQKRNRVNEIIM